MGLAAACSSPLEVSSESIVSSAALGKGNNLLSSLETNLSSKDTGLSSPYVALFQLWLGHLLDQILYLIAEDLYMPSYLK